MDDKSAISQAVLNSLNVEQGREENKACLEGLGGVDKLIALIGTDSHAGLTHAKVLRQRELFGENKFPESPMDSYIDLLIAALSDTTLLILVAAAAVSLVIGVITEPDHGWIEGAAIFIAVFLVANISAGNDYTKQLQFKALEQSSAADDRTSVLREGNIERVNPMDLVVGDILVLQVCMPYKFLLYILCAIFV
jgi:magnesium-transporting ATPase (P-type)